MRYILLYAVYFIPNLLVTWFCWLTNPIVCLFPHRLDNGRDELWGVFNMWSTFDAPVDEYFYGGYAKNPVLIEAYVSSRWIRYKYRLRWLYRNTGYGWAYLFFAIPRGKGFQWKGRAVIPFWFFGFKINDYNIGWRDHPCMDKLDYAGRIIGLRKT